MTFLLSRFLEPLNPVRGHLSESETALRTFRSACVLVALLVVPFGWLYHASGVAQADPMWVRWGIMAAALGFLAATFCSRSVARWALRLNQGLTYALTVYFGWLAYAHDLSSGYGVGYLFVFVSLAMAHSLSYRRPRPFAIYLGLSTVVALVVALAVEAPAVPRTVFMLSTTGSAGVIFIAVGARLSVMQALAESEAHLAEAQVAAAMGSWEQNLRTGDVRWSASLFRLTGHPLGVMPPRERMITFAHPDNHAQLADWSGLANPSGPHADTLPIRYRRCGSAAWRHADVRRVVVCDDDGRPSRLFGTLHDTTGVREREATLRQALRLAEEAASAKSDFLANMSHEIRTPLTAILGFAQLLGEETGDEHRDLIAPIESAGQRLLSTLNSVLDLARMEAGEADIDLVPVDATAEVRAAAALLASQAAAKGLALDVQAPDAPLVVLGDAAALSRVLVNLASNAVKFTERGGVTVRASEDAGQACLTVRDTGRGMDAAFLTEVFEPFRQASTGWARSHEGTGLGLTIVKRLVEGMRGTIAVESAPGQGTCFTVRLPLAPVPVETSATVAAGVTAREPVAA